jgi:hypothetical protein
VQQAQQELLLLQPAVLLVRRLYRLLPLLLLLLQALEGLGLASRCKLVWIRPR